MPSYTYKCEKHGEFTVERSIKDEPLTKCIYDGCENDVERIYKATVGVSLGFKGSYNSTR